MSRIVYPKTSQYSSTPQGQWHIGPYAHRRIPRSSDDRPIVLEAKHEYRPDVLALELYGTASLWWVFMLRNMNVIRDPLNDFTVGKIIFAPSMGTLKKVLGI
jgi:hypothetical protein